jgi:endonuclease/exonuclease/phosphatase family metal-dependent hydrolase
VKIDTWVKEEQVAKADEDVVVIGDFNDKLTDPQQWNVFGPLLAPADGGFLTLPLEQAGGFTYIPFDSFIDHVHVRGAALHAASSAEVLEVEQTIPGYEASVSDHRPVIATLRFEGVSP